MRMLSSRAIYLRVCQFELQLKYCKYRIIDNTYADVLNEAWTHLIWQVEAIDQSRLYISAFTLFQKMKTILIKIQLYMSMFK